MDIAEGIDLATKILDGGTKAIALATAAIQAFREKDNAKALALLDQSIAHFDATTPVVAAELAAIKPRVEQRIADRFDKSDTPAPAGMTSRELPRRVYVDLYTPAEKAIHDAMSAVEALPASVHLTEAVTLLGKAKDKVADYVDGQEPPK
jgi:L-asparaginase II